MKNIPSARTIVFVAQSSYQTLKMGYEAVKNAWGSFSNSVKQEIASLTSNPVDYISNKFNQGVFWVKNTAYEVVNYYNGSIKPLVVKYAQPVAHRILNPIVNSPVYKVINSNPIVNRVTSGLGWLGNKIGIW